METSLRSFLGPDVSFIVGDMSFPAVAHIKHNSAIKELLIHISPPNVFGWDSHSHIRIRIPTERAPTLESVRSAVIRSGAAAHLARGWLWVLGNSGIANPFGMIRCKLDLDSIGEGSYRFQV